MASEGKTSCPSSPLEQGLQAAGEGPETPRSHPGPRCQNASWERSQRGVSEEPSRSANTNAGQKPASFPCSRWGTADAYLSLRCLITHRTGFHFKSIQRGGKRKNHEVYPKQARQSQL